MKMSLPWTTKVALSLMKLQYCKVLSKALAINAIFFLGDEWVTATRISLPNMKEKPIIKIIETIINKTAKKAPLESVTLEALITLFKEMLKPATEILSIKP